MNPQATCKFCNGQHWINTVLIPIPPYHDLFGSDSAEMPCPLCHVPELHEIDWDSEDSWPNHWSYTATAVGGFDGAYTMFSGPGGTFVADRSMYNFWAWGNKLLDCPVCSGWGIWNVWGRFENCLACGGLPVSDRCSYRPAPVWYLHGRWEAPGNVRNWLYLPVGTVQNPRVGGVSWTYYPPQAA